MTIVQPLSRDALPRLLRLKMEGCELAKEITRHTTAIADDCRAANALIEDELWQQSQALEDGPGRDFLEWLLMRARSELRMVDPPRQRQWTSELDRLMFTVDVATAEWLLACLRGHLDRELAEDAEKAREIHRRLRDLRPLVGKLAQANWMIPADPGATL